MPDQTRIVSPGPDERTVRTADGRLLNVPGHWVRVPPGDPGLTRRIKAAGPTWTVQEIVRRKTFSRGVWTDARAVEIARADLERERAAPQYAQRRQADARRREQKQTRYVESFEQAVLEFLAFDPRYDDLARRLAQAVAQHATPVGSGTVARTQRIAIQERAQAAVIAWMRHQTTAYDSMPIARIRGQRREVRRMLAERSRRLLEAYRAGRETDGQCPLQKALRPVMPG